MNSAKWKITYKLSAVLRGVRAGLLFGGVFFVGATPLFAQDTITPGVLELASTFDSVSVRARYTGDTNANGSATISFRPTGSVVWLDAYTPIADRRSTISGQVNPYVKQFRGSIVGLATGTSYDVRVTMADPDGVSGAAVVLGTVSTIASAPPLPGREWYVDDDAVDGDGSAANPFNAIASATDAASAGDIIRLRPGRYPAFTITKSGTSGAWVALVGDDRDTTVIEGGAVTNNITIAANYIQVKNLRFKQTLNNSVAVNAGAHHVWLDNLYHEDVSSSRNYNDSGVLLKTGSHHIYVLNNVILAPGLTAAPDVTPRWDSPGVGINVSGAMGAEGTFVFKRNIINGGFRDCIGNSFEEFGGSTRDNTDIAHNTISGCKDDAIQMEGDDVNLRIWGNDITADNGYSAIAMSASYVGPVYVFRNVIRHTWTGASGSSFKVGKAVDTFYFHNTIEATAKHDVFSGSLSTGQVLRNNVIVASANPLYCMGSTGGSSYDYNLYYRASGGNVVSRWNCVVGSDYATVTAFAHATGNETHGFSNDPLFVDAAKHIDASSPAHDRGVVIANFNDIYSSWPFLGSAPDVGAHEVGRTITPPLPPTSLRIVR